MVHAPEGYMHSSVQCISVYSSQDMEATYISISRGMGKEDVAQIYSGILLSHKNNEIMSFVAEIVKLREIGHRGKNII